MENFQQRARNCTVCKRVSAYLQSLINIVEQFFQISVASGSQVRLCQVTSPSRLPYRSPVRSGQ